MKKLLLTAALLAATLAATAQTKPPAPPDTSKYKVLIGTGGAGNTYDTMSNELMARCSQGDTFGTVTSGGTLANIDDILANRKDAGWGQEDSLFLKKSTNPEVKQLKTLVTLHPEEVHVFVRVTTGLFHKGESKYFGLKTEPGAPVVFTEVEQLAGMSIAAWGGSYDTARLVSANGGLNFTVVKVANSAAAFAALDKGTVQGVLAVAGAPSPAFEALPATYKLVPFRPDTVTKLVAIYDGGAILNYTNLGSEGVKTISTNAILFTREFQDSATVAALAQLRACTLAAVPALRDTRGSHKKWRAVNVNSKGKWDWYNLPAVAAKK